MITGFNTDVEYQGVTYHVQTEDKGVETPLILSLVYNRGTILASKRSPYDDLLNGKFDEKTLAERLQKQHKLMCAAISSGRIEDLKRMTERNSAAKQVLARKEVFHEIADSNFAEVKIPVVKPAEKLPAKPAAKSNAELISQTPRESVTDQAKEVQKKIEQIRPAAEKTIPNTTATPQQMQSLLPSEPLKPAEKITPVVETRDNSKIALKPDFPFAENISEDLIIEGIEIIEDEIILPAEAVEIVSEVVKFEPPQSSRLKIDFPADLTFKGGDRKTISFLVCRGTAENGIGSAQVMIKVLGSSFRPLIFHAKTDQSGVATVHLQLPHFRTGRAALLVRAMNDGEQVELRRVIMHN